MPSVVVAKEPFSTEAGGYPRTIGAGETFSANHPIVAAHPNAFDPFEPDNTWPVEETTAEPGGKRGAHTHTRE